MALKDIFKKITEEEDWNTRRAREFKARRENLLSKLQYTYEDIKKLDSYKRVLALGAKDTTSEIMKKRRVTRFSIDSFNINEDIFKPAAHTDVQQRQTLWKSQQVRDRYMHFIETLHRSHLARNKAFLNLIKSALGVKEDNEIGMAIQNADTATLTKLNSIEDRYYWFQHASKHYLVYPNGYLRYWDYGGDPRAGILKKMDEAITLQQYSTLIDNIYSAIDKRIKKIKNIKKEIEPFYATIREDIFEPAPRKEVAKREKVYWTEERIREDILDFLRNMGSYGSLAATARFLGLLRGDFSPSTKQLLDVLEKAITNLDIKGLMKVRKFILGPDYVRSQ